MRFPVVLFDLDGTVLDSGQIILASFRHATRTVLEREIADEELLAGVGLGLHTEMRAFDEARADELVRVYRDHNAGLQRELRSCTGTEPVLDRLREEGRRLGLVTSKRRASVEAAFGVCPRLARHFETVVTVEDTERHKPDPAPILLALEQLGAPASEAAYVGDAPFDVEAAKAAGVFAVAATWGGMHSRERLESAEPDAIVDSPEELHHVLA